MPYVEYDEVQSACSDCGRAFPSEEALADHRTDAHGGLDRPSAPPAQRVGCSVCSATFRSTAALLQHSRRVHTN